MRGEFATYADFWPVYLRAHSRPGTRRLHAIGTGLGLGLLAGAAVTGDWRLLPAAVLLGYGFAWAGHFWVEGNRPASFGHPLWSLLSDFRMLGLMLGGRMGRELDRYGIRRDRP